MKGFDDALELLKMGAKVRRSGWKAGMFLYLVPAGNYPARTEIAKKEWGENGLVPYQPYIAIKTEDSSVATWVATQADLLTEDWESAA